MDKSERQSFVTELRRGSLAMMVLGSLYTPHYGYDLLEVLQGHGVEIEANTLYPLLRRLEKQGLLDSTWDTSESRPRKYYTINQTGEEVYQQLLLESEKLTHSLRRIQRHETDHKA